MITEDTLVSTSGGHTLYQYWTANVYIIYIRFGNGTTVNMSVKYGEEIQYPEDVAREGYTFKGWDISLETMPANDTTISAEWTANNYTLTFDANGGDSTGKENMKVTYDST